MGRSRPVSRHSKSSHSDRKSAERWVEIDIESEKLQWKTQVERGDMWDDYDDEDANGRSMKRFKGETVCHTYNTGPCMIRVRTLDDKFQDKTRDECIKQLLEKVKKDSFDIEESYGYDVQRNNAYYIIAEIDPEKEDKSDSNNWVVVKAVTTCAG